MMKTGTDRQKLKVFFTEYLLPYKWALAGLLALILLGVAMGSLSPYLYGRMVDAINAGNLGLLALLIAVYCLFTLSAAGLSLLEKYCGELTSFKMVSKAKKHLFEKIAAAKCSDFSQWTTGEYISRLEGDVEGIVSFFLDLITNCGQIFVNLLISVAYIIGISVRLSSVAAFYLPASFLISFLMRRQFRRLAHRQRTLDDKNYSFLSEMISNHSGIKAFQLEKSILNKYSGIISEQLALLKHSVWLNNVFSILSSVVKLASAMYIIYVSALLIRDGQLTLGDMVAFNTYINLMFSSAEQIWSLSISLQTVQVSVNRFYALSEIRAEEFEQTAQEPGVLMCQPAVPVINFSSVSFTYPHTDRPILDNLSLCIPKNGLYSVVGKNGCGKSTLAKLLVRFYDADQGCIFLYGTSIEQYSLNRLRKEVTYVSQEHFLLRDTVFNNVALSNPNASLSEVKDVCRRVHLDDFIHSLPQQYNTVIGEDGSTRSSGQRQKIGIARALLRESSILVLDEVTANLDGRAEREIMTILRELSQSCVVLLISHKVASVADSDTIFVIDRGHLAASGRHDELMQNCPQYRELFGRPDGESSKGEYQLC